jgi:exosome complex component RRP41
MKKQKDNKLRNLPLVFLTSSAVRADADRRADHPIVFHMTTDAYNEFTGLRADGRRPGEMRLIQAHINAVPGCTGSANFKMGQTEVLAQIFGPSDGKSTEKEFAEIFVSLEFADFAKPPHPSQTQRTRRSRESELLIKRTFEKAIRRELYPTSRIDISVTIIQDDGGILSAAINAVTLALIDAGVPVYDFVVSLTVAWISDMAFLDTGRLESSVRFPVLEIAIFPRTRQIVSMNLAARISPDAVKQLMALAIDGCLKLHRLMTSIVRANSEVRAATVQHL